MGATGNEIQIEFGHLSRVQSAISEIASFDPRKKLGEIVAIGASSLDARFENVGQGAICRISSGLAQGTLAEVIAIKEKVAKLAVLGDPAFVKVGDRVDRLSDSLTFPFSEELLGRVVDGIGQPMQRKLPNRPILRQAKPHGQLVALDRPLIKDVMLTGVPAIDGFLTLGRGQRVALFGPPGCGKSTLLASIMAGCSADVIVLALVGERGREVQEFLQRHLADAVRRRSVVVVSTSDKPALERAYAVDVASSIAEGFREKGKNVLLLVDSMTRVARALREIGLAAGEPPVRRGFPASVYAALPKIIERAGLTGSGSITAIYTVLSEGDTATDPIVEEIKSLTDGHIQLDPDIASAGRFPAVNVLGSLSRVMSDIAEGPHLDLAANGRRLLAKYDEIKLLIQIGEYTAGQDPEADEAIAQIDEIRGFVHSSSGGESTTIAEIVSRLRKALHK